MEPDAGGLSACPLPQEERPPCRGRRGQACLSTEASVPRGQLQPATGGGPPSVQQPVSPTCCSSSPTTTTSTRPTRQVSGAPKPENSGGPLSSNCVVPLEQLGQCLIESSQAGAASRSSSDKETAPPACPLLLPAGQQSNLCWEEKLGQPAPKYSHWEELGQRSSNAFQACADPPLTQTLSRAYRLEVTLLRPPCVKH